jgi:hypothetical protein
MLPEEGEGWHNLQQSGVWSGALLVSEVRNMGKRVVETADLAEAFAVKVDTIREWAKNGKLPPPIPGFRRFRWRWEDVRHLLGNEAVA